MQYSFLLKTFLKAFTFNFSCKPCKYVKGLMLNFSSSHTNSCWRTWVWSYPSSGPNAHGAVPFIQTPYPRFLNCLCLCFIIFYVRPFPVGWHVYFTCLHMSTVAVFRMSIHNLELQLVFLCWTLCHLELYLYSHIEY